MPIPGYDPADIDDMLERLLTDEETAAYLTEAERAAYERGDESLVDLLERSEIERILDRRDVSPGEIG